MKKTAELDRKYTEFVETGKGDPGDIIAQLFNHAYGLEHATSALKKEVDELRREREWISVKDRLPKVDELVLCQTSKFGNTELGSYLELLFYVNNHWETNESKYGTDFENNPDYFLVTHWMPIPKPIK